MRSTVITASLVLAVAGLLVVPGLVPRHPLAEPGLGTLQPRVALRREPQPGISPPAWVAGASKLLAAGRWTEAVDELDHRRSSIPASEMRRFELLAGIAGHRAGRESAGAALAGLLLRDEVLRREPLAGLAALEAGRALRESGDVDGAAQQFALAAAGEPTVITHAARLDWAHLLVDADRALEAGPVIGPLLGVSGDATRASAPVLALAATAARAGGQVVRAEELEFLLWRDHPGSEQARGLADSASRAEALALSGRAEDVLTRASHLVDARRPAEALATLEPLEKAKLSRAARDRELALRGRAEQQAGRHALALKALSHVGLSNPEAAAAAALAAARSAKALGRKGDRRDYLRAAAEGAPCEARDQAALELAELEEGAGSLASARARWTLVATRGQDPSRRSRAGWALAWSLRAEGDADRALAAFDALVASAPTARESAAALYWSGRDLLARGDAAGGRARLTRVREEFPNDYHAVVASDALGEPLAYLPLTGRVDEERALAGVLARLAVEEGSPARRLMETCSLGLLSDALEDIQGVARAAGAPTSDAAWQAEAIILGRLGRHEEALRLLRREAPDWRCRRDIPAGAWDAAYPLAYESLVREQSELQGVDPTLVFALIHQESVFRPAARSWVGATGLMQIMPGTGRTIAGWLGEPRRPDLNDPDLNVRYGTTYLRRLVDTLGREELALAGYNAGGGRVRQWSEHVAPDDLPLFIESIPFDETRDYVKAIAWNRALYAARGAAHVGLP